MGVATDDVGHALVDLARALASAASRVGAVPVTAARAVAEMIGDQAAVQLLREQGGYDPIVFHPADPDAASPLARLLHALAPHSDDGWLATLRTAREPVLLTSGSSGLDLTGYGVHACLLCPLLAGDAYLGYLALARTAPDRGYPQVEVNLARDIAAEVTLALSTARTMDLLRLTEERYRQIVDTALEGIWQLDSDGVTTSVNRRMADMLGLSPEQVSGQPIEGFLDAHSRAELPRWLAEPGGREPAVHKARLLRADGAQRWVQISAAPLPVHGGGPAGSLYMITDITDQEQARALKRQLDHLRRLDSLAQLIGGIAHDFNNLLTVIAGSAEMIASTADPESLASRLATEIADATVRGRTLARQLLAFGRAGGRLETVPVPDLLDSVSQLLNRTLGEHIRVDVEADEDVWAVRAERGPLEQVLVNLAANARDAMPHGGVLCVRASNVVEPGDPDPAVAGRFVRMTLSDTGVGMDRPTRQRAFEPFFTTKANAAGLGLATAASILRAGGGHIQLSSEPRIGTTVELLIPAAEQQAPAPLPDPQPAGGHVLVVEDQPELAHLLRHLLEPAGYTVTVATDPETALRAVPEGTPLDLLLADVVMPGMTGPELATALRERHPGLRVVYTSGYAPAVLGPQAQIEEDSLFLQKPFNRETLLSTVRRAWR